MTRTDPILVIRFGSLGDVILSFATGRGLKQAQPERPLVYLVKESYAELVGEQPWADETIVLADQDRDAGGARRLRDKLAARSWSAVCDLQDSPRSRYLRRGLSTRLAVWQAQRAARRLHPWMRGLRRFGLRPPQITPEWLRFAEAGRGAGLVGATQPRVEWSPGSEGAAAEIWREWGVGLAESVVAMAPAAAWPTKEWPPEHALQLARDLVAQGHRVLLLGTAREEQRLAGLANWVASETAALWPRAPLTVLAALLARCRVAVTPDSGLMHLAAAVGLPVVALFGSTVPELGFAPAGEHHHVMVRRLGCQPCALHGRQRCPLGHFSCLRDITPSQVMNAVLKRLNRQQLAAGELRRDLA